MTDRKRLVAIYPGTFDPITNGHWDIMRRALGLFDQVVVALAVNVNKKPLFPLATRTRMIRDVVGDNPRVKVEAFRGLLVTAWLATSVACAWRKPPPAGPGQAVELLPEERLGIDDVFEVRVFGESDLSDTYRVAADGTIQGGEEKEEHKGHGNGDKD